MLKLSVLRNLEGLRSLAGSTSTAMKAANPKPSSGAGGRAYGSFANLKITAEKLAKGQASVKTDLEMAHTKLRRATEQINLLEGKLQQAVNENAKLKVKQTEDSILWQGLDKVSSTKTLCRKLTKTPQQLFSRTEQAEEDKKLFEEKLGKNSTALDEFYWLLHSFNNKLERAEETNISGEQQMLQIKHEKEEIDQSWHSCSIEREKTLEKQKLQVKASLAATECQLVEAKKQYDLMLEGKQIELSKHLKELSMKNDQAINDIRKKYELEKIEITSAEKQKAEKLIWEMESKCNENISENKKDSESYLMHLKEEHGSMVARIQQDNEHKESTLRAYHKDELQRIQSQAENELERLSLLGKEHELQIKSLRIQHEEECQRLQEELELQKSKEEKQRALLQLQWKVMGENQQVDQEVNSKKVYFVSSIKKMDSYGRKEHELQLVCPEVKRKDVNLSQNISQMPITNMLNKLQTGYHDFTKNIKDPLINTKRCFSTDAKADKEWQELRKMSIEGNTALVVIDGYNRGAFKRSYVRGLRKLIAWCRRNGIYRDLS